MNRNVILYLALIFIVFSCSEQKKEEGISTQSAPILKWELLKIERFNEVWLDGIDSIKYNPEFTDEQKELDNQLRLVKGTLRLVQSDNHEKYFVVVNSNQKPDEVFTVKLNGLKLTLTEFEKLGGEPVQIEGVLKLNLTNDPNQTYFYLEKPRIIGE